MAGCLPCFIIPLLLFIFHRYIQPIVLKFWNPWENKQLKEEPQKEKNQAEVLSNQTLLEEKKDI